MSGEVRDPTADPNSDLPVEAAACVQGGVAPVQPRADALLLVRVGWVALEPQPFAEGELAPVVLLGLVLELCRGAAVPHEMGLRLRRAVTSCSDLLCRLGPLASGKL